VVGVLLRSVSITWLVARNLLLAIKLAMIASSLDIADVSFTIGEVMVPSKSNFALVIDWRTLL
jgi:hypothetical protein